MDQVFEVLHNSMPVFYILAGIAIIAKMVFVVVNRGPNVIAVIASFFKIYSKAHIDATSPRRKGFMRINNYINYFIYAIVALFVLMLITFQSNIFRYS